MRHAVQRLPVSTLYTALVVVFILVECFDLDRLVVAILRGPR